MCILGKTLHHGIQCRDPHPHDLEDLVARFEKFFDVGVRLIRSSSQSILKRTNFVLKMLEVFLNDFVKFFPVPIFIDSILEQLESFGMNYFFSIAQSMTVVIAVPISKYFRVILKICIFRYGSRKKTNLMPIESQKTSKLILKILSIKKLIGPLFQFKK